jgi:hypothetical protein
VPSTPRRWAALQRAPAARRCPPLRIFCSQDILPSGLSSPIRYPPLGPPVGVPRARNVTRQCVANMPNKADDETYLRVTLSTARPALVPRARNVTRQCVTNMPNKAYDETHWRVTLVTARPPLPPLADSTSHGNVLQTCQTRQMAKHIGS